MFTIDTKAGEMLLELLKATIDGFVASGKNNYKGMVMNINKWIKKIIIFY